MKNTTVKIGNVYGRWTVISFDSKIKWRAVCKCECGEVRDVIMGSLERGTSKSCGCYMKKVNGDRLKTHSMSYSKEYVCWHNMKRRCLEKDHPQYPSYGGRGISLPEKWLKFEGFIADMGTSPKKSTLDRIDNSKSYSKENCRWIDHKTNCRNKRNSKRWNIDGVCYESITDAMRSLKKSSAYIKYICEGRFYKGKFIPPKNNCWSEKKYQKPQPSS